MRTSRHRRERARSAVWGGAALALAGACCQPSPDPTWAACARITSREIDECSGIVASRRAPGVLWVHNDSGDRARFFGIDSRGDLLTEVEVEGARNVDWEDIATDDAGRLYLGDFGNNRNMRRDLAVYVVGEPDPGPRAQQHVSVLQRLAFRYPDQAAFPDSSRFNFDCEAMFWVDGALYLLTKHRSDLETTLYRLDPRRTGEQVAERLGSTAIGSPVTAADCSADGQLLVVLSYQYIHLFRRPPHGGDWFAGTSHRVLIEGRQCEGVALVGDRVLFTNEQREIHCLPLATLWKTARYLPQSPRVEVPAVEPRVDGRPDEWSAERGRLRFDRFAASSPRTASDSFAVRLGWTPEGMLVHLRWQPPAAAGLEPGAPVAWLMLGSRGADRPCLGPGQAAWGAVFAGDTLALHGLAPEPGLAPCGAQAPPAPFSVATRRAVDSLAFEAYLPAPVALAAGGELLFGVVLLERGPSGPTEIGWSAVLDMQPLGNPLLWGRARLLPAGR